MEFLKFISVSSETSKKVDTIHTEYSEMQKDAIDYFNKSASVDDLFKYNQKLEKSKEHCQRTDVARAKLY